jgi:hypothetical protein
MPISAEGGNKIDAFVSARFYLWAYLPSSTAPLLPSGKTVRWLEIMRLRIMWNCGPGMPLYRFNDELYLLSSKFRVHW